MRLIVTICQKRSVAGKIFGWGVVNVRLSGVDQLAMIGAYRFPDNAAITTVEVAAKASSSSGAFSTDAILFGKWRD